VRDSLLFIYIYMYQLSERNSDNCRPWTLELLLDHVLYI